MGAQNLLQDSIEVGKLITVARPRRTGALRECIYLSSGLALNLGVLRHQDNEGFYGGYRLVVSAPLAIGIGRLSTPANLTVSAPAIHMVSQSIRADRNI